MTTIFGREGELGRISRVLDSAQANHLVRAVRILGPSGVGKTALATAGADAARDRGWLIASAQCFRIHSSLPLFLARRLARSIVEALRDRADTYRSGLNLDSDKPEQFEEAFYRLIEAVTLDFPLVVIVDDAQWSDQPSRDLIVRLTTALADRPIVLLSTERNDESPEPAFALQDEAIAVGELTARAAEQLARSVFPSANDDVVASIIASAGARAVDIVAVAEAARDADASTSKAVNASTRTVIARDLALVDPPVRTFLQTCALIEEPIDFGLLRLMWPREELLDLIDKTSGRYLVEDEGELRFVHAAVMESVHETIPIEIPLRYRIIHALKQLPSPRLEDLERLAQQAASTRDVELERETVLKLAQAAVAKQLQTLAADAMERALRIAPPQASELVAFYTQLSQLYNVTARESDTIRICKQGLEAAAKAGIREGVGSIAASLILALYHTGQYESARKEYERYLKLYPADPDRAQILSVGAHIEMNIGNFAAAQRIADEFSAVSKAASPFVLLRFHTTEAFTALRRGDETFAFNRIAAAEHIAEGLPPIAMTLPRNARMLHAAQFLGVPSVANLISSRENELSEALAELLLALVHLARGEFSDLRDFVAEKIIRRRDRFARRLLLTPFAVSAAFDSTAQSHQLWGHVVEEVAQFHLGERATPLVPLVAAWLATVGKRGGPSTSATLNELIDLHARPMDSVVFTYPVLLALASQRLEQREGLRRLTEPTALYEDKHGWAEAQNALARGVAMSALGDANANALIRKANERFEQLGMPFFASYAGSLLGATANSGAQAAPNKTTRREREVAALVADGMTNKEIAERLVLSERTVEGHIANLFAKVNVGSRTQLAAWFLKTMNSAASSS